MDDLLDLNWSAPAASAAPAVAKSKSPSYTSTPNILSLNPTSTSSSSSINASFDFLSKPLGSSSTPNYYATPPLRGSTPIQPPAVPPPNTGRVNNTLSRSTTPNNTSQPISTDVFSSLLSLSNGNGNANGQGHAGSKTMTMAEKQAALVEEKKRKDDEDKKRFEAEGHFWENLGSTKPSTGASTSARSTGTGTGLDTLLQPIPGKLAPPSNRTINGSPSPTPPPAIAPITSTSTGTVWDDNDDLLGDPSTRPLKSTPAQVAQTSDFLDFDSLDQLSIPQTQKRINGNGKSNSNAASSRGSGMRTPVSDFNFGEREDNDEDDILGDLGKPVQAKPQDEQRVEQAKAGPSRPHPPKEARQRSTSLPPHIVGQIVEMGFSPAQARQALAKTPTGVDVEAALELLLAGNGQSSRRDDDFGEADDDYIERERHRREEAEKERRRRRRAGPSRESVKPRTPPERERGDEVQDVLAQASEIGQSVLKSATMFWNTGKEKAAKIYEEKRKAYEASAAAGSGGSADGTRKPGKDRPKWMIDAENGNQWDDHKAAAPGVFSDDGDKPSRRPKHRAIESEQASSASGSHQGQPRRAEIIAAEYKSTKERADLLFADEEPQRYVSPARHPKPKPSPRPPTVSAPKPAPVPLIVRQLVSATPAQIQSSATHKSKGNEHFKLGRFAEAATAYTSAISALPEGHILLVPLHNNRAAARLKLGESSPAVEDCTIVIDLIGLSFHPSKEAPLPPEFAEVKLADGLVKATIKRAQAWEMGEKWKKAAEDWERVMSFDAALLGPSAVGSRKLASEGARRAKKMVDGDALPTSSTSAAAPKPNPRPKAVPRPAVLVKESTVDESAAVAELRKAAQAAEKEDEERYKLKDSIDTKINNWKGGKENNLRALIASLDMVLWDSMLAGGLKVGMHELVSEKQVKIKYMKVIARLHPDKLNTTNTTVEQRMLANGAFGALSEAWQAFNK